MMSVKITESTGNVFADLGFPPEKAESLRVRSQLMIEVLKYIKRERITQEQTAVRMGVKQPRISEIKHGKVDLFTIDQLVTMLARVGVEVSVKVKQKAA
jgi:predicted XRE-type DNA-binding protein